MLPDARGPAWRRRPSRLKHSAGQTQIVMWWNFIGRSHEEVAAFREDWQRQRADLTPGAAGRYGAFPDVWEHTLPAPELPNLHLRSRG